MPGNTQPYCASGSRQQELFWRLHFLLVTLVDYVTVDQSSTWTNIPLPVGLDRRGQRGRGAKRTIKKERGEPKPHWRIFRRASRPDKRGNDSHGRREIPTLVTVNTKIFLFEWNNTVSEKDACWPILLSIHWANVATIVRLQQLFANTVNKIYRHTCINSKHSEQVDTDLRLRQRCDIL